MTIPLARLKRRTRRTGRRPLPSSSRRCLKLLHLSKCPRSRHLLQPWAPETVAQVDNTASATETTNAPYGAEAAAVEQPALCRSSNSRSVLGAGTCSSRGSRRRGPGHRRAWGGPTLEKGLTPRSPAGSNEPTPSAQAKARAITLRTEVACHCPPPGALIPRAYRASAICRSDVAQGHAAHQACLFIALRFNRVQLVEIERVRGLDGRVKTPLARKLPIASRGGLSLTIHRLFLH